MISSTQDGYGIQFDFLHPFQCFYQYDIYRGHKYACEFGYNESGQLTLHILFNISCPFRPPTLREAEITTVLL